MGKLLPDGGETNDWNLYKMLTASDGVNKDEFGTYVTIAGNRTFV